MYRLLGKTITSTKPDLLSIGHSTTNFSENSIKINIFSFQEYTFEITICRISAFLFRLQCVTTLRPRQNGRHFPDEIFKWIFLMKIYRFELKCRWSVFRKCPTLVQIMAWRRSSYKPLSEAMMFSPLTHICVTRPQCVKLCSLWLSLISRLRLYLEPCHAARDLGLLGCFTSGYQKHVRKS